ncbi:MAG: serpin family protein [Candidatus Obscuribacterales bacterium]
MNKRSMNSIVAAVSISLVSSLLGVNLDAAKAAPTRAKTAQDKKVTTVKITAKDAVVATEKFGLDLFQKLSAEAIGENCFISPASVAIALNFAMAGSGGATHEAMAGGLKFADSKADTAGAFSELIKSLSSQDKQVEMNIANSIFVNDVYKLNPSFEKTARDDFQSEIRSENFADSHAVNKINAWVSEKTQKHIPSILDKLSPQTFAVLLNAIYFKGVWTTPFPVENSKPGDFHLASGATKKVRFMNDTGKFSYFEEKDLQAVKLPYGNERFEALVFLPAPSLKLADFEKRLTAQKFDEYVGKFEEWKNSQLTMPTFHIDYGKTLNKVLSEMGFANMFSDSADFSRLHTPPPNLKVSEVIHKTTLDVDEKGTVATAATSVGFMPTAVRLEPQRQFKMNVNRPFVFAIRDSKTGLLIFVGSVYEPEKK